MSEQRKVRCLDCGYEWKSSASDPRCSKSDCGRSRNVEPVTDLDEPDDANDEVDDDLGEQVDGADDPREAVSMEDDEVQEAKDEVAEQVEDAADDASDDGDGYEPMFKSRRKTVEQSERTQSSSSGDTADPDEDEDADSDEQEADADDATPEVEPEEMAVIFETTMSVIDTRMLTDWELEEDEAEKLGRAWCPVANKWLPHLFRQHSVEAAAVIATASLFGPKFAAEQKARKQKAQQEDATEATGGEVREPDAVEQEVDGPDWEVDAAEVEVEDETDEQLTGAYAKA